MTSIETKEISSNVPYYYLSMCTAGGDIIYFCEIRDKETHIVKKSFHDDQTLKKFRLDVSNHEFVKMFLVSMDLLCVVTNRKVIVINVNAWKIQSEFEMELFEHFAGYLGTGVISNRNIIKVVSLVDGKTLKTFEACERSSYVTALAMDNDQIISAIYVQESTDMSNKVFLKAWSLNGELENEYNNFRSGLSLGVLLLRNDQLLVANNRHQNTTVIDRLSGEMLGSKNTYFKNTPIYTTYNMLIVDHRADKTIKIHGLYENEVVGEFHDNNWQIAAMSLVHGTKVALLWEKQYMRRDYYNVKQYKQKMSILDISDYKKKISETKMSTEDTIKAFWDHLRNPESNFNIVDLRKRVSKFKSNTSLRKKQRIMEKVLLEWDNKVNKSRENFLKEAKVGMGVNKLIDYAKANKHDIILKNVNNKEELAILEVFDWYWSFEENQSKSDNKKAKTNANFKHLPPIRIVRPNI